MSPNEKIIIVSDYDEGYDAYLDSEIVNFPTMEEPEDPWTEELREAEEAKLRGLIRELGLDYDPTGWGPHSHSTEEVELNWKEEIILDYPFSIADDHTRIYLESFEHARKELEAVVEHHKIRAEEVAEELRQAEQEATWMEEEEAAVEEED